MNAGSQSVSNGIQEPAGDTFALDQAQFEQRHDLSTGLGPEFNATSCAECHQNVVTGAASQITEMRVGHSDANGNFVNPTILINNGADKFPAAPSSTIAPYVRKRMRRCRTQKIYKRFAPCSTHWAMVLLRPWTTEPSLPLLPISPPKAMA